MLLNYVEHSSPTSHKDVLQKMKNFAVGQGWVLEDQQISKEWLYDVSKYDWLTGTEDYIYLSSTGRHAAQNLHHRFRARATGVDPSEEYVYISAIDPADTTIDDQDSTHPIFQNYWCSQTYSRLSMSPGTTSKVWIFGNSYFIFCINLMAADFWQGFMFGTFDVYDPAETEMGIVAASQYTGGVFHKWYNYAVDQAWFNGPQNAEGTSSGSYPYYTFYHEGGGKAGGGTVEFSYNLTYDVNDSATPAFNDLSRALIYNQFSGKRMLIKPVAWVKWDGDGLWRPAGVMPYYLIYHAGLAMGEVLDFGGEEYMCFPNQLMSRDMGIAFRIT